jgi:biopolymer transport protein ExbB
MLDGLIVNGTLGGLIMLSVVTWTIAWIKIRQDKRLSLSMKTFEKEFFAGRSWIRVCELAGKGKEPLSGIASVAIEAVDDILSCEPGALIDPQTNIERAMHQAIQAQLRVQEKGLSELATIGSISPFVGLFGTVWGIMNALKHIGETGQASIDVVAGPVGEALIATAVGIAVAIPAVLFYNHLLRRQKLRITQMESFAEACGRIAMKHVLSNRGVRA